MEIDRLLASRQPDAVKLTKVKGHAKFADIQAGLTTKTDKHGNDEADAQQPARPADVEGTVEEEVKELPKQREVGLLVKDGIPTVQRLCQLLLSPTSRSQPEPALDCAALMTA